MQNKNKTQNVYVVIRIIVVTFSHMVFCLDSIESSCYRFEYYDYGVLESSYVDVQ